MRTLTKEDITQVNFGSMFEGGRSGEYVSVSVLKEIIRDLRKESRPINDDGELGMDFIPTYIINKAFEVLK